ncbi:Chaperone protein HtpG [Candidatus Terasakiella magnetica]|uniref:Chaperone protein HtpG n=1 Tax=Candidatus Terasakiella magnetica TaxID=1867952 RepID=A0A1C3RIQ2_9PROT|nr:molecular chaperone HtpG [Candidatus Terasakiella magnetica]SCA57094.1 Chaperone protein HtpG [Candidatus Terasakiella magnetica]
MTEEKLSFQAEVSKLLHIVTHSLYSNKEIFLRELISNASDACDKLRYESQTDSSLIDGDSEFKITLSADKEAKTLTLADNGIGMNHDDLINNLGTIAKSGTEAFLKAAEESGNSDVNLIGQFGVGFYSSFMVADEVIVSTRKAGEDKAWVWTSTGQGEYTITDGERDGHGTTITMKMREDQEEFLDDMRIRNIIKTYSDHIDIAVVLKGEEEETLNSASAIWTRSKSDITEEQYKEFYHHVAHAFDDPWLTLHNRVEGVIEYTNLLFIPGTRPMDLFTPERKNHLKLYVNRVFITDDCDEVIPQYLRFVRGVVDSGDLPLNVSREMLQHNPVLAKIKAGLTKKVLGELKKKAEKDAEGYAAFWENFGAVMKEGIYEDFAHQKDCLALARFKSTNGDDWVSLADYVERMKEGQDEIFYISGDDLDALKRSPQLEGFKAKGVEVLLMTDPIDEFWIPSVGQFEEKNFQSITKGGADLSKIKKDGESEEEAKEDSADKDGVDRLCAAFKVALGDSVQEVRSTDRLTDSAVCIVASETAMDRNLQRMLKQHGQAVPDDAPILEVNPTHSLIKKLVDLSAEGTNVALDDAAHLLLDQARIIEGENIPDMTSFARRMTSAMEKGLM